MARFRKEVIGAGGYQTPDGAQVVTPARLKHWATTINEMVGLGIKPPLSWGHGKAALPHADDDPAFWRSRLVAGKLTGAEITPSGRLAVTSDAPGVEQGEDGQLTTLVEMPDGRKVRSVIEEVSIGAMDWTDGTGRVWKDAPVHVALTPLPVWVPEGGQPPFEKVEDEPTVARFSTASLLYRFASEGDMADEDAKDTPGDGEGGGEDAAPEVGINEVLDALASIGLTLPESTTEATLFRDIVVGAAAIAGAGGEEETPVETPVEADGGTASGAFMSTLRDDPIGAGLIARLEADDREKRLARVASLSRRGLPGYKAKAYREQITAVRFSTDARGTPQKAAIDDVLDALDAVLPPEGEGEFGALFSTGAGVPTPPEGLDEESRRKKDEAAADELARNGGLPARKRGA